MNKKLSLTVIFCAILLIGALTGCSQTVPIRQTQITQQQNSSEASQTTPIQNTTYSNVIGNPVQIPTNSADCSLLVNVSEYCPALSNVTLIFEKKGQVVDTGNGQTMSYNGSGVGLCDWSLVNEASFKSLDFSVTFYQSASDAQTELQSSAQAANLSVKNNEVTYMTNATPEYDFNSRLVYKNANSINVNVLQFASSNSTFYCTNDQEKDLINAVESKVN